MKNFVITGSNGWFSHNFKNSLKKQKNHNVNLHEVDAQNAETVLNKITDLNVENIYLIHNGYIKPKDSSNLDSDEYIENLINNRDLITKFIQNNDISKMFYPSTGSIYGLRMLDKNKIQRNYTKQKEIDETVYYDLSKKYDFKIFMPRIFSVIGPSHHRKYQNSISSMMENAFHEKKIEITSRTNNIFSICYLDCLNEFIISFFDDPNSESMLFDAANVDTNILELAEKILETLDLDNNSLTYSFSNEIEVEKYVGDNKNFIDMLNYYQIKIPSLGEYLHTLKILLEQ